MYRSPCKDPSNHCDTDSLKLRIIVSTPMVMERATVSAATAMLVLLRDARMVRAARKASTEADMRLSKMPNQWVKGERKPGVNNAKASVIANAEKNPQKIEYFEAQADATENAQLSSAKAKR